MVRWTHICTNQQRQAQPIRQWWWLGSPKRTCTHTHTHTHTHTCVPVSSRAALAHGAYTRVCENIAHQLARTRNQSRYCKAYSSSSGSTTSSCGNGGRPPSSLASKLTPRRCRRLRPVTSRPIITLKYGLNLNTYLPPKVCERVHPRSTPHAHAHTHTR